MSEQDCPQPPKFISGNKRANQWAMFVHFSLFAGIFVPFAGLVLPIVLWQIKKNEYPFVDVHGKIVVNWLISLLIYSVLSLLTVGIYGLGILGLLGCIFQIVAGIKANQGEVWEYPISIKFVR